MQGQARPLSDVRVPPGQPQELVEAGGVLRHLDPICNGLRAVVLGEPCNECETVLHAPVPGTELLPGRLGEIPAVENQLLHSFSSLILPSSE